MRYNNYHKHDEMSSIFGMPDSGTKQEEYVKRCVELEQNCYFTTNHGSFGDIFEAKNLCDKYSIKCIAGLEGYVVKDSTVKDDANYHIVIIPKTNKGRRKMNVISSKAHIEGFYRKPRLCLKDILKLDKDDIYITTACEAGIVKTDDSIENILIPLIEKFGDNVLLEVQNHNTESQKSINIKCLDLAKRYGLKLIAANDSHYIDEKGKRQRAKLLKGKHINYGDEDTYTLDFPTYETMVNRFKLQGVLSETEIYQAIDNTLIFDTCEEIDINKDIKMPNIYPELSPKERYCKLENMVWEKFKEIVQVEKLNDEEIKKREQGLIDELEVINLTNEEIHTADYFLFNQRNVDLAINKYNGVLTKGGRGSAPSFYTNKTLGITELDRFATPIPLYPDRFMSVARLLENKALPDVDFNVASQEPFVKASKELLGDNGCFPMIAYGTMGISEAFRNACRAKDMDFEEFNEVGKNIDAYRNDVKWKSIIEEAESDIGIVVSSSVHPCAFILSDKDLIEEYGVVKVGDVYCVMITSSEADDYKVLKNDYLIVKIWKLISETFKLLNIPIISAKELLDSIKDDCEIWGLYEKGLTCTLNQVDSDWGTQLAKRYKMTNIEEASMITAAIRPAFDAWRDKFIERQEYSTGSTQLDKVLQSTKSFILFQENLMQYFDWLGVTPAESIGLIKKISKKKIKEQDFYNLETRIKQRWIENTGTIDGFDETWNMIQGCMSYGFCSAHAYATALDMAYGAYCKIRHPFEYYTVCFNNYMGDEIRTNKLTKECEYFKIDIKSPVFRKSKGEYFFDKETNSIYKGIGSIKYINNTVGDELYTLKDNHYDTFIDLLVDIKQLSCNTKQLDLLIKIGFFNEFGSVKKLLSIVEVFNLHYGKSAISKAKIDVLELSHIDMSKYANDKSEKTGKETKTWKLFDSIGLIKELSSCISNEECELRQILDWQNQILGYITYTDNSLDKRNAFVQNVDGIKGTRKVKLYCLNNGKTSEFKVAAKLFNSKPFIQGQTIYTSSCEKRFKAVPEEKDESGKVTKWGKDTSVVEWWLSDYRINK